MEPSPPPENISLTSRRQSALIDAGRLPHDRADSNIPSYFVNAEVYSTSQASIQEEGISDGQTADWEEMISSDDEIRTTRPTQTARPPQPPQPTQFARTVRPTHRRVPTVTSIWPTTTEAPTTTRRIRRTTRSKYSKHSRRSSYPIDVDAERIEAILQASMQTITSLTHRIDGIEGRLSSLERTLKTEEDPPEFHVPSYVSSDESRDLSRDREPVYLRAGAILVGMSMLMGASHLARRGLI